MESSPLVCIGTVLLALGSYPVESGIGDLCYECHCYAELARRGIVGPAVPLKSRAGVQQHRVAKVRS